MKLIMNSSELCCIRVHQDILWNVWYTTSKEAIIPWNTRICQEWLVDWIVTWITKDQLKDEIIIPCPNNKWTHHISLSDMQKGISLENFEIVLDKLLNVFICNSKDIRKWPNLEWSNAGIITEKPWYEQLHCAWWDYKWKDITQLTFNDKLHRAILGNYSLNSELLSYLSEITKGEPWPHCGIVIIKSGGCPHMACQKCSYEFWWDWLGYYKDYGHIDDTFWPLRLYILYSLVYFFLFSLNFKVWYSFGLIAFLEKTAIYLWSMLIIWSLFLSSWLIELFFIHKLNRFRKFRPKYKGKEYKFTVWMIVIYPIFWIGLVIIAYCLPETENFVVFMLYEIIAIALILSLIIWSFLMYKTGKMILKIWKKTPSFFCKTGYKLMARILSKCIKKKYGKNKKIYKYE